MMRSGIRRESSARPVAVRSREKGTCVDCGNTFGWIENLAHGANINIIEGRPFHDLETEYVTLGAMMMIDADATETGMRLLRPHFFFNARALTIFRAMQSLWQQRHLDGVMVYIEPVSVGFELRRIGLWEDDYAALIPACVEQCPTPANIAHYVRVLEECYQLRQLIELSIELTKGASMPDAPRQSAHPTRLIAAARRALDNIESCRDIEVARLFEPTK